jgi:hypothetical protein
MGKIFLLTFLFMGLPYCSSLDGKGPISKRIDVAQRWETAPHWLRWTPSLVVARKYFVNFLEYFVDASVSESSESVWRGGIMPRDEQYASHPVSSRSLYGVALERHRFT